jgi:alpha-L-fucosidase
MVREGLADHLGWLYEARFGMFIHWGLYSVAARHEWVKSREMIRDEDYDLYFRQFQPDLYDPRLWAREANNAGMRYFVVTTKHHEGFCLWDSQYTDYKATNTPAGRDLLAPMVEAFRAEGLRVGFYYSLLDWHHPEFPVDGFHPRRNDEEFKAANTRRDIAKYREYLHNQVRELLTRYGKVDYLFFDFSYPKERHPEIWGNKGREDWGSDDLVKMVRDLQPGIVINDRLDLPGAGDVATPEQYQPSAPMVVNGGAGIWEACQTLNGSWGYDRDNLDWKSPGVLVRMLVDGVSKDGNMLLNVGPTGRGELDERALSTLHEIGKWMRHHRAAIYGCGPAPFTPPPDCRYTLKGDRLYLHVFSWPFRHLHLPGLAGRVEFARFLHDGSEVRREVIDPGQPAFNVQVGGLPAGTLTLDLPVQKPSVHVPVVELILRS